MSLTWHVIARREFLERVRSKWFIAITLLGPLVMSAIIVVPAWLGARAALETVRIQVVDQSGHNLFPGIVRNAAGFEMPFDFAAVSPDIEERVLLARIREEKINGFLFIPKGVLEGEKAIYRGDNATNIRVGVQLQGALYAAARDARALAAGVDPNLINRFNWPKVELEARHDTGQGGHASKAQESFLVGYVVMFVLYVSILIYAVNVMRSVVLEKTSRVIEIVVSATRPSSLMFGKVIGVGSVGLLQLAIWAGMALLLFRYRGELLGAFGVEGGDVELPPLSLADVAVILAYFALGYFLYAALYAAIGAMVNSDQDAQQAQTPVVMLLILPVVCVQLVAGNPRGPIAQVLTLVPFSSPILMPMRYLLKGATPLELALSMAILLATLLAAIWVAGRIYRIGILMYGKRPSLRELGRWIRYSS